MTIVIGLMLVNSQRIAQRYDPDDRTISILLSIISYFKFIGCCLNWTWDLSNRTLRYLHSAHLYTKENNNRLALEYVEHSVYMTNVSS
jgi:hypothetical protein